MAKPNYQFEKRQRELEKKRKKAEKLQRKNTPTEPPAVDGATPEPAPEPVAPEKT